MLPLLRPAALSDPSSHRNTQRLVHWSQNWKKASWRIYLSHFRTKKMYIVVLGAGRLIHCPEITTSCSKLDLLFWTMSCTLCKTAIINLTEPLSIDTWDLHPVVPGPISWRHHVLLCLTSKTALNWLTGSSVNTCSWRLHALRTSGQHTVLWEWCASGIQNTPSATFCPTNCR